AADARRAERLEDRARQHRDLVNGAKLREVPDRTLPQARRQRDQHDNRRRANQHAERGHQRAPAHPPQVRPHQPDQVAKGHCPSPARLASAERVPSPRKPRMPRHSRCPKVSVPSPSAAALPLRAGRLLSSRAALLPPAPLSSTSTVIVSLSVCGCWKLSRSCTVTTISATPGGSASASGTIVPDVPPSSGPR